MGSGDGKAIENIHFKLQDLTGVDWSGESFISRDFDFAILQNAIFVNSDFTGASFMHARLWNTDFSKAKFISANLSHANSWKTRFIEARMTDVNFRAFHGRGAIFRNAILDRSNFRDAELWQGDFRGHH